MKHVFLFFCFFATIESFAQSIDFEDLQLLPDTFWNGSEGTANGFSSGGFFFPTVWDTTFDFFSSGFAYSNKGDTLTAGFSNLYSCFSGSGAGNSSIFALANGNSYFLPSGGFQGLELCNSTYAYLSMLNGDAFAKKFGGASGDDPDFFGVDFTAWKNNQKRDSLKVYLADFRFSNNSQDYILKDWTFFAFPGAADCDSVSFSFFSSDVGAFGINTPMFFCLDNVQISNSLAGMASSSPGVYPNPGRGEIFMHPVQSRLTYQIIHSSGRLVDQGALAPFSGVFRPQLHEAGVYLIHFQSENRRWTTRYVFLP